MKLKCLLFSIACMLIAYVASSQNLQVLQQKLNTAKTTREKIYALDAIANYFTWSDGGHATARAYGRQMIALAEKSKQPELEALAYILNGIRLLEATPSTEREKESRAYFAQAIQISKENQLPFYEASSYIGLSGSSFYFNSGDGDEVLEWGKKALYHATTLDNDSLRALALIAVATGYQFNKNNIASFRHFTEAIELSESLQDPYLIAYCYRIFAHLYVSLGDQDKALSYYSKAIESLKKKENLNYRDLYWLYITQWEVTWAYLEKINGGNVWEELTRHNLQVGKVKESVNKLLELAKVYHLPSTYLKAPLVQLLNLAISTGNYKAAQDLLLNPDLESFLRNNDFESNYYSYKAKIFHKTGQLDSADYYYRLAIANIGKSVLAWAPGKHQEYGNFLLETGKLPEAIHQFEKASSKSKEFKNLGILVASYKALDSAHFSSSNILKAYEYKTLYHEYYDSLQRLSKDKELALLEVQNEQKKLDQAQTEKQAQLEYRNRLRVYSLLIGIGVLFMTAGILYRNNRQKQRANAVLKQQKEKTEQALHELKATQDQLVQKEKMASLGELTAGIAHEIQNPLNFVNNFSEVSQELVCELREELQAGRSQEAAGITVDLEQNLQKINHHGRRADAIVKNMLQHSRPSTGEKQLANLNTLTEEYLRFSYFGIRAKDKDFTCTLETYYDQNLEKVEVVPQELGRVLLNIFNNAFYAVQQKQKQRLVQVGVEEEAYKPTVSVSTRRMKGREEIRVRDNGTGMPESVKSKIFQPFFTTKPTGQGTGLGLSLSYDIITKGHGGEMRVASVEGEWAEIIVTLPHVPLAEEVPAAFTASPPLADTFPQP